jgi:hypothetical protein
VISIRFSEIDRGTTRKSVLARDPCMAYRDLRTALETKRTTLAAQKTELEQEVAKLEEIESELREVEAHLEQVNDRRRLPMLSRISVATPCNASWEDMRGNDRVRFCGKCEKNVYNLSAMSEDEAETLVYEQEGDLCVRFYRRKDGTLLTSDCPEGKKRRRRMTFAAVGLAATAMGGGWYGLVGEPRATMGAIEVVGKHTPAIMGSASVPVPKP